MICTIFISPNMQPTKEELDRIIACFIAETQPYRIQLIQNYNKLIPNHLVIAQIENQIDSIKKEYIEKYSPYLNF